MEDLVIKHAPERHRFEIDLGDGFAFIEYTWHKKDVVIMHTYVPDAHRGQGIAGKMIKQVLDYARDNKIPLIVYCPSVSKYIETHQEYQDLLDKDYAR
jgi:predicted GNAT family acetyltransferase